MPFFFSLPFSRRGLLVLPLMNSPSESSKKWSQRKQAQPLSLSFFCGKKRELGLIDEFSNFVVVVVVAIREPFSLKIVSFEIPMNEVDKSRVEAGGGGPWGCPQPSLFLPSHHPIPCGSENPRMLTPLWNLSTSPQRIKCSLLSPYNMVRIRYRHCINYNPTLLRSP